MGQLRSKERGEGVRMNRLPETKERRVETHDMYVRLHNRVKSTQQMKVKSRDRVSFHLKNGKSRRRIARGRY